MTGLKHYGYISFMTNPRVSDESHAGNLSFLDQRTKLEEHAKALGGFSYIFAESEANTGSVQGSHNCGNQAFAVMLKSLVAGDTVHIYSWKCLINSSNMGAMGLDILDKLRQIKEVGVNVYFVYEKIGITTPSDKLTLTVQVAMAQYDYDMIQENLTSGPKPSCCSSSSSGC